MEKEKEKEEEILKEFSLLIEQWDNGEHLELEARLGTFKEDRHKKYKVSHGGGDIKKNQRISQKFTSGLPAEDFKNLRHGLLSYKDWMCPQGYDSTCSTSTPPPQDVSVDVFYDNDVRVQYSWKRIAVEDEQKGDSHKKVVTVQQKIPRATLNLFCPNRRFGIRLRLAEERPIKKWDFSSSVPHYVRLKLRQSFPLSLITTTTPCSASFSTLSSSSSSTIPPIDCKVLDDINNNNNNPSLEITSSSNTPSLDFFYSYDTTIVQCGEDNESACANVDSRIYEVELELKKMWSKNTNKTLTTIPPTTINQSKHDKRLFYYKLAVDFLGKMKQLLDSTDLEGEENDPVQLIYLSR
jgi:hypothetical protein